jgi:phosphatidylserine/phosphatidylglycerophosphate/cardiolipin synthase-like enzyme
VTDPTTPLDWAGLASYAATPFPHGWNPDEYVLFAPRDPGVHSAILDIVRSASYSVVANHYGFDDDEISSALLEKSADPEIAFILNLDSSQAGGVHEKKLLAAWQSHVGTSVAVGTSIKHAISHLKVTIVDGLYVVSGSTNLSLSGEQKQDNELRITRNALMAARYSAVILLNHAAMLAAQRPTATT